MSEDRDAELGPQPRPAAVQASDPLSGERLFIPSELTRRHRNMLGVIRSIVRRMSETSETVEEFGMHLEGRLDAIGRWYGASGTASDSAVRLDVLVGEELMTYQAKEGEQVSLTGPTVNLKAAAAESLGLAFHELATNALKFGALSAPSGHVAVNWSVDRPGGHVDIAWSETGGPAIASPPERQGLGTEILEHLLDYELKAQTVLTYERTGLHCAIRLPLTSIVAA